MSTPWKAIRLELTSTADFPFGSAGRAYIVLLPLNDDGEVDEESFLKTPHKATFRRHWASDPDQSGQIHRSGGKLDLRSTGYPDRMLEFSKQKLRLGVRASLLGPDGATLPLQVVSIH